ncbi:uncharacterized protein TNCV_1980341 [Trichonephila clavipes]|nr:uncharacterized protein TNCV_1980341 [Trichonephila clavipes]
MQSVEEERAVADRRARDYFCTNPDVRKTYVDNGVANSNAPCYSAVLISLIKCALYMMYREYVTVGHCEHFIIFLILQELMLPLSIIRFFLKKMKRSRLLEETRMDLVQPQWDMRSELSNLSKILKRSFTDAEDIKKSIKPPKKRRCTVCPRVKDVKTTCFCLQCKKNMCLKHMNTVCSECLEND